MKKLILSLLLAPFLLISQPQFSITDYNGDNWNSNELLEQGITIFIQFYSPSMTCWPSANSTELFTEAYNQYAECNKLFFLQVAEWGTEYQTIEYLETFGTTEMPTLVGNEGGQTLTFEFMDWGLQWAHELWLIRPDGSYEVDIPFSWDLEQQVLIDAIENEGFNECENNLNTDEDSNWSQWEHLSGYCCTHCASMGEHAMPEKCPNGPIFDLQGRQLNKKPTEGFYIQEGKKYIILK